jgi:methionyl-tRNA formyltransferase
VLLYSAGHLGSAIVLNRLYHLPEIEIVGVVRAEPAALSRQGLQKAFRRASRIGWRFAGLLAWQRLVQFVMFYVVGPLIARRRLMAAWQLADRHGIPSHETSNINGEAARTFLSALQPDILISAYFAQIIKAPVLGIPWMGALNVHPGWLPDYKGAMNYFWVVKNGEDRAGVSVHWMDEGIDTGAVLARRSFVLEPDATQQQVLAITALIGARLLERVIRQLHRGENPQPLPAAAQAGRYFPMPGAEDFDDYFKRRRFFRIRDIFRLATRRARTRA